MTDRGRPSQIETARQAFRQRLLTTEATATETVARQYVSTRRSILQHLAAVEKEIAAAGEPETAAERIEAASRLFRSQRYQNLLRQIDAEIARLGESVTPVIADAQGIVVRNGVDEVRQLSIASAAETSRALALKVAGQWSMLPTSALNELIGSLSDGSPLAEWVQGYGPDIAARITDTLRDGLALGFHPRKIFDQLTHVVDGSGARLMLGTRSIILDSYRAASLQQMEANSDILDGWVWQADHSSRTCGACLALDNGEIHPVTETFMGTHVGCRCNPRPVVTGTAPPSRQTGEQYFASLPPEQQDRTLGIAGGKAFRDGKVSLRDFVHKDTDERWGDRYRQGSLRDALGRAGGTGGRGGTGPKSVTTKVVQPKPARALPTPEPAEKQSLTVPRFATSREAREFLQSMGTTVTGRGRTVEMMQVFADGLAREFNAGKALPSTLELSDQFKSVGAFVRDIDAQARQFTNPRIVVNPYDRFWRDPTGDATMQHAGGFWSTDDPLHPITHEMAHFDHYLRVPSPSIDDPHGMVIRGRTFANTWPDGTQQSTAAKVSRYGASAPREFVAETYAGMRSGVVYDQDVMDLYKFYEGPEL